MNSITIEPFKTSGPLLDYLVAICEGKDAILASGMCQILTFQNSKAEIFNEMSYLDSIEGYDIIEREKIDLLNSSQGGWNVPYFEYGEFTCTLAYGKTMREAGLRRYVQLKLGDSYVLDNPELIQEMKKLGMEKLYDKYSSWTENQ